MSYEVLARKWRPRDFSELVGQGHVLKALTNALDSGRLHHAYLFTGTRGVGKTSLARVLARALNCEQGVTSKPCGTCSACVEISEGRFVDLIEVDAASRTKVDETRDLLDNVQYAPTRGRYKVYLIDEVHMFSNHSFNALLKTLEEPPPHVKFLLATTDPKKLPVTILSRCLQFNLKRLPTALIADHLARVLEAEKVAAERASLELIATAADGSVRDALSLLDQALAFGNGELTAADVASMLGTIDAASIYALLGAIAADDGAAVIRRAREMAELAPDYAYVLGELLSILRRVAVWQQLGDAGGEDLEPDERVRELAGRIEPETCQLFYQLGLTARRDLSLAPDPETGFEMALLRMMAFRPAPAGGAGTVAAPAAVPAPRKAAPAAASGKRASGPPVEVSPVVPAASPAVAAEPEPEPVAAPPVETAPAVPASSVPEVAVDPDDWPGLVAQVRGAGLMRELARNAALRSRSGDLFELVVTRQFEHLSGERQVEALERELGRVVGRTVRVRLELVDDPDLPTPSAADAQAAEARQRAAEQAVRDDPLVLALQETFDATIERVNPR